jgi:hypothetical protein
MRPHSAPPIKTPTRTARMSYPHLARLVQAYLQRPGAQPGERSPDDAFTVLSPLDGHCVAIDWCPVDDTALICAHPFEGHAADQKGVETGIDDEDQEAVHDLGREALGQWWLHEDLITGRTTLALRAPVATWTVDDFSSAFEAFCRRLASMGAAEADSLDGPSPIDGPAPVEAVEPVAGLLFFQRA